MGSEMANSVPLPGSEVQDIVPPCFSSIICRAIAIPNPVPFPTALVVNPVSNIRPLTDSGIPTPLSEIRMMISSDMASVQILIWLGFAEISSKLRSALSSSLID